MKTGNVSKIIIPILIALMLLIFSGCTRFDIDLGIDSNNTARLSYRLEMDISEFDEHQRHNFIVALHEIALHYQDELGFSINLDIDSNPIVLAAEKEVMNNSFEEAFSSLESMLTDADMTFFMQVDMGMINYPRQTGYVIEATLDVPRIIKSYDTEDLPPPFQASLEDAIHTSRGTITVSLPADEVVDTSHGSSFDNGQATMAVPISFSEETTFNLSGTINIPGGLTNGSAGAIIGQQLAAALGDPGESAIEQQLRLRNIALMATIAAAGLIFLTLIITIVVVIVKKRGES